MAPSKGGVLKPGTESAGEAPDKAGRGTGSRAGQRTGTGLRDREEDAAQTDREPFIKGENGKIGWDVIRAEEEKAKDGNVINVDMNGTTVVPADIFEAIKDRDITITFDMGGGILWSVDGKGITGDFSSGQFPEGTEGVDLTVKTGENAIPVDIINNVTGENYSIQISLVYEGEFGFTAVLSINVGKENAGLIAGLYYYNKDTDELELICSDEVAEDGTASLAFTHASDYVIVLDEGGEASGKVTENVQVEGDVEKAGSMVQKGTQAVQGRNVVWFAIVGIIGLVVILLAVVFINKKKKEK